MTILDTTKGLLGLSDGSKDTLLEFLILSLTNKILGQTRQTSLPTELETFVVEKVVARYLAQGGDVAAIMGQASAIKRGDFSVSYKTGNDGSGVGFGGASLEDFSPADLKVLAPFTLIKIDRES